MHKYKLANGWTKASVMAQVKKYNNGSKATNGKVCLYLTPRGNRCAIGCFIPDGHPALNSKSDVVLILREYGDLKQYMPFDSATALMRFQNKHDTADSDNVYDNIQDFLNNEVE